MSWKSFACVAALSALIAMPAVAQPTLNWVDNGGSATLQIIPDAAGGSIAAEIGISFTSAIDGATLDLPLVFDTSNPGNNNFTGGITNGLWDTNLGSGEVFASYGSIVFPASSGAQDYLTLDYSSSGTFSVESASIVAQGGANFSPTVADLMVTVGSGIDGDFDMDGDVDGVDLGVFGFSFANSPQGGPPFADGDFDMDGDVDGVDLGVFGFNFVNFPPSSAAVPEPTSLLLVSIAAVGFAARRRS